MAGRYDAVDGGTQVINTMQLPKGPTDVRKHFERSAHNPPANKAVAAMQPKIAIETD